MQITTNTYETLAPAQFNRQSEQQFNRRMSLDAVADQLKAGQIFCALDDLFEDLAGQREEDAAAWPELARRCSAHALRDLLLNDPFTWRAFAKPRGYAGDAVMMDYIYGLGEAENAMRTATPLGRSIFRYMDSRPSARAVRYRRTLIAGLLDRAAERTDPRVLAIAAGHLREVDLSAAVQGRKLAEFVAIDQDEASLAVVSRDYGHLGVTAQPGSVRQILSGKANLGQYDLVYAAGLYDYLSAPAGRALTRRMFEATRPGGTLLIPNFLTGIADAGYMEAFMDWRLIYRDHAQMYNLAADIPAHQVASLEVFNDPDDTIAFLIVTKASNHQVSGELVREQSAESWQAKAPAPTGRLLHQHHRRLPERRLLPGRIHHRHLAVISPRLQLIQRQAESQRHRLRLRVHALGHRQRRRFERLRLAAIEGHEGHQRLHRRLAALDRPAGRRTCRGSG